MDEACAVAGFGPRTREGARSREPRRRELPFATFALRAFEMLRGFVIQTPLCKPGRAAGRAGAGGGRDLAARAGEYLAAGHKKPERQLKPFGQECEVTASRSECHANCGA